MITLTAKEWSIVSLVAEGLRNQDIAVEVGTSEHVIKNRLRTIYDKLGFWNRTEVALWYVRQTFKREAEK